MFRRVAVVISGLLAVAMLPLSVSNASATEHATGVVLTDGAGDVWFDPGGSDDNPSTRGSFPPADVKRAVVRHATYALRIRMRFVTLRREGSQGFEAEIQTPTESQLIASVTSVPGHRRGRHFFSDEGTTCPGMTHRINYATDVVRMRIPRSCLGRPRWVKVSLNNFMVTTPTSGQHDVVYFDNPHNHEPFGGPTRRLYRG
jgi:hypothetical protein